jgi:hypothetical protein
MVYLLSALEDVTAGHPTNEMVPRQQEAMGGGVA